MKIYFAGSIRGGREDAELYWCIIRHISRHGEVLTEHVGAKKSDGLNEEGMSCAEIHDRDLGWLAGCDAVVAEVSTPSLGVGYEIGRAIEMKKPLLCLYNMSAEKPLSAMIAGCRHVTVKRYKTVEEACAACDEFLGGRTREEPRINSD